MDLPAVDAFREGRNLNNIFPGGTAFAVLFLCLVTALLSHYNKLVFKLNLKIGG